MNRCEHDLSNIRLDKKYSAIVLGLRTWNGYIPILQKQNSTETFLFSVDPNTEGRNIVFWSWKRTIVGSLQNFLQLAVRRVGRDINTVNHS